MGSLAVRPRRTVEAYERAPVWQRWLHFVVNQRPILFIAIPPFYFLGSMRVCARVHENVLFAVVAFALYRSGAWVPFALARVPASWLGFLIFHAAHTFEGVLRRSSPSWDFVDNALFGSSMIVVPEGGFLAASRARCAPIPRL